jgi:hypothetical protein
LQRPCEERQLGAGHQHMPFCRLGQRGHGRMRISPRTGESHLKK